MEALSERQSAVLKFIERFIQENGYPPTIREIGKGLGIKSTNGVSDHIKALRRKGYVQHDGGKSRALIPHSPLRGGPARLLDVPVVGKVAAGRPVLAEENVVGNIQVDSFFIGTTKKVFALKVTGDSMIGDGIRDGDFLFVKRQQNADAGDIVVAMLEGEATCKRYYPERDKVRLQPSNPSMQPIYVTKSQMRDLQILGAVVGVYRKLA